MLSWNFNFCTVACIRRLEQEAVILEKRLFIMAITVNGMKLESDAFGNQSFPQATSNKNYMTSEFGRLERVIRHFHSHSGRVSVKESTKAVFNDAA